MESSRQLRIKWALFALPIVWFFVYLYTKPGLEMTTIILAATIAIPSAALYCLLPDHQKDKIKKLQDVTFQTFELKSIDEVFTSLRVSLKESQESLAILHYLRKKVKNNVEVAVELIHLGAFQHAINILQDCSILEAKFIAALEFLNEILHQQKAREELIVNEYIMKECVDNIMNILCDIINQTNMIESQLKDEYHPDTETQLKTFYANGYMILLTIGLLCSDNNSKLQCRIAEKSGLQNILLFAIQNESIFLSTREATNSDPDSFLNYQATATSADNNTHTDSSNIIIVNYEENVKLLSKYTQWAFWAIFNIILNNPPNKSEFYHLAGVRIVIDILTKHTDKYNTDAEQENNRSDKLNKNNTTTSAKGNKNTTTTTTTNITTSTNTNSNSKRNIEVYRQGLAILLIMLTNDSYAKYSVTQARQMAMASNVVNTLHFIQNECKNACKNNKKSLAEYRDIIASSKAILNLIINDWS